MSQNFSNQNLRGRAFIGQDLRNANFERADIRGANFFKANLQGANFSYTKAGLNQIAVILLLVFSCLLTVASGLASGFICYSLVYFSQPKFIFTAGFPPAIALYVITAIFIGLLLKFDITTALKGFGISFAIGFILSLPGACLEKANLARVKASGCDFRTAILTGACLESLQHSSTTQFDKVICDYVYLLVGQKERRPITGNFNIGEFQQLFSQK